MVFQEGKLTPHFLEKTHNSDLLIVQVYVDDIIFGATKEKCVNNFPTLCKVNLR